MDQPVTKPRAEGFEKLPGREIKDPVAPTRPRRRFSLVGTILTLLVIGGIAYAVKMILVPPPKTGPAPGGRYGNAPQSVGVATLARGDITIELQALGTVTPLANVTVKTQIDGPLQEVGFTEGQAVKKGDFLAQIDPRPYQALVDQYEGQLARDQGLLDQAKFDLIRYQTLLQQNSIARQTAEDQKFLVQQDEGTVRADQGLLEAQKVNLAYCHITAPVDGRVGLRQVDPGNYVQTSDTNGIVVLTQLQPISVIFSVPENVIPKVVDAMKASAALKTDAFDQANTEHLATGAISALDNVIDTTTGMLKARAIFDNPDNHLYPNQFVNVHLVVGTLHDVVVAPAAAIQRGTPGTFVYVVGADSTVSVRKVTVGPTRGTMVAVTDGVAPGERVVIDGSDRLRDGSRVVVPADTRSGAADQKPTDHQGGDHQGNGDRQAGEHRHRQGNGQHGRDGAQGGAPANPAGASPGGAASPSP
jgi:multidrug efflux system membrane fusion protein